MSVILATILMMMQLPSAAGQTKAAEPLLGLVPQPARVEMKPGHFSCDGRPVIGTQGGDTAVRGVAERFAAELEGQLDVRPVVRAADGAHPADGMILLTRDGAEPGLGEEGYELTVGSAGMTLRACTAEGLYHGTQTIRQLLPWPAGGKAGEADAGFSIPALEIHDVPQYAWRGMHLDVCRHFMPVSFVKRFIDLMALHKFNVFHWHLTDDQGWRIEIKRYPRLTEVGAWREENGQRYGGFYTQDEVREIVAYAAERYITVVPEIEMPGHSMAALAAYPELSCTGGPFEVPTTWGIFDDVYCVGNEKTFEFLQNVLDEVLELFPSRFIHVGGDECPKTRWKACPKCQALMKAKGMADEEGLQSYLIHRIDEYLTRKGRRLVGWDEILEGGLAPGATVMSWRGTEGGIKAAQSGHDVIMSPTSHCYFDYRQSDDPGEPGAAYASGLTLSKVYAFDPTPNELSGQQERHVLGGQANVWTERIHNPREAEYMVFPRLCAMAEALWSPESARDWKDFRRRMDIHVKRLQALGVNFRPLDP